MPAPFDRMQGDQRGDVDEAAVGLMFTDYSVRFAGFRVREIAGMEHVEIVPPDMSSGPDPCAVAICGAGRPESVVDLEFRRWVTLRLAKDLLDGALDDLAEVLIGLGPSRWDAPVPIGLLGRNPPVLLADEIFDRPRNKAAHAVENAMPVLSRRQRLAAATSLTPEPGVREPRRFRPGCANAAASRLPRWLDRYLNSPDVACERAALAAHRSLAPTESPKAWRSPYDPAARKPAQRGGWHSR